MEFCVDDGFQNIPVTIELDEKPSMEKVKEYISRGEKFFRHDLAYMIIDRVRNQWLLDLVGDTVEGADAKVFAKYFVSANLEKVYIDPWGKYCVPCVFDGEGLVRELLGEDVLDRALVREDCPYV